VPELEEIEMLRSNHEVYSLFMDYFVSCMPGKDIYRRGSLRQPLSMVVTVTDEAMTMLVLKNNYALWTEMTEKIKLGEKKVKLDMCTSKQLFFDERKGRGRSWSDEGKVYFNNIYKAIITDRQSNSKSFDEKYLESITQKNQKGINKESRDTVIKIECMTDFSEGGMFSRTIDSDDTGNDLNKNNVVSL
jgi:hypothetical protein